MTKIALIVGSVRHDRQGIKVAPPRWMEQKLKDRNHTFFFIDPNEINLPLLDRMYKEMTNPSEMLRELENKIKSADMIRSTTCLTVREVNCGILFELSTTSFKCEVTGIATISNNFALSLAISYIEYEQLNAIKTPIGHLISVIDKSYLMY